MSGQPCGCCRTVGSSKVSAAVALHLFTTVGLIGLGHRGSCHDNRCCVCVVFEPPAIAAVSISTSINATASEDAAAPILAMIEGALPCSFARAAWTLPKHNIIVVATVEVGLLALVWTTIARRTRPCVNARHHRQAQKHATLRHWAGCAANEVKLSTNLNQKWLE